MDRSGGGGSLVEIRKKQFELMMDRCPDDHYLDVRSRMQRRVGKWQDS
jgi:hypothetical protein